MARSIYLSSAVALAILLFSAGCIVLPCLILLGQVGFCIVRGGSQCGFDGWLFVLCGFALLSLGAVFAGVRFVMEQRARHCMGEYDDRFLSDEKVVHADGDSAPSNEKAIHVYRFSKVCTLHGILPLSEAELSCILRDAFLAKTDEERGLVATD